MATISDGNSTISTLDRPNHIITQPAFAAAGSGTCVFDPAGNGTVDPDGRRRANRNDTCPPNAGFNGSGNPAFRINDGTAGSHTATVTPAAVNREKMA